MRLPKYYNPIKQTVNRMEVELLSATPDPEKTICLSARNDYLEEWIGDMTFEEVMYAIEGSNTNVKMDTLIGHLMEHGHFGPFEHVEATFAVKGISRSCMAQITRHRHASFDIQSMRYVNFSDMSPKPGEGVVLIPELETTNPAGRNVEMTDEYKDFPDNALLESRRIQYENAVKQSFKSYRNLVDMGVAPENARMVLPIGTKVNMVVSMSARTLMHVGDMRAEASAQWEVRGMTSAEDARKQFGDKDWIPEKGILELAEDWCPKTFDYYNENMKGRKNRLAP